MKRNALNELEAWKRKSKKKPLLIRGARQVGKTWIVREFAKTYTSFVEINLDEQPEVHALFDQFFGKPKMLIQQLSLLMGVEITPQKTLLFIDEAQENKNSLMSLRTCPKIT